jgi:molecular chaperone Hsp33
MQHADSLRRFVFERYPFRGQLVHLGPAWRAMMEHHEYPDEIRDSLGEAAAATVLLAATLKFQGQLSLQLRGAGPMHLMLVNAAMASPCAALHGFATRRRRATCACCRAMARLR